MYSLVIAEDEFTTRRGLVNMVRWKELGFQVDGEFSDGRELLDYLRGNTPDVILTDIRMTQVGGMEIARFVAQQNLSTQVVFLSGHKEFALAQEAVSHHVYHYLLKPVDLSRLREVFRGLKEKLDQMSRREERVQGRLEHYNRLVNYERQQFVTDAYFGSLAHPEQIARRLRLLGAGDQAGDIRLFLVKLVLEKDSQYQDFLDNYGTQELQEQLLHVLAYFDRNLEYYPITWGSTKEGEMSLLGVFWETETGGTDRYKPRRLGEAIYELLAIRARVERFLHLDAPEELVHCTKQVGMKESGGLMEAGEYLQLLQDQNRLLCTYLCQNDLEQGLELVEALCRNYLRGGSAFAVRYCIYTVMKLLEETGCRDLSEWNQLYARCMDSLPPARPQELPGWLEHSVAVLFDYRGRQNAGRQDTSIEKVMGKSPGDYRAGER